jgi:hypothetical protein
MVEIKIERAGATPAIPAQSGCVKAFRVSVDKHEVTWSPDPRITMGVHCYHKDWFSTAPTAADFRKLGVILSEIADTLEANGNG